VSAEVFYYHGGPPDLRVGDLIEPQPMDRGRHLVDGCPVCEARKNGKPSDYDQNHRFDRVYVTTDKFVAKCFAAGYPRGSLYRVEPIGDLEPDPEHEQSFAVPAARIVKVAERGIDPSRWSKADVRRFLKLGGVAQSLRTTT